MCLASLAFLFARFLDERSENEPCVPFSAISERTARHYTSYRYCTRLRLRYVVLLKTLREQEGAKRKERRTKKEERGEEEERSRTTRKGEKQSGKMTRGWYREVENGDFDDAVFSVSVAAWIFQHAHLHRFSFEKKENGVKESTGWCGLKWKKRQRIKRKNGEEKYTRRERSFEEEGGWGVGGVSTKSKTEGLPFHRWRIMRESWGRGLETRGYEGGGRMWAAGKVDGGRWKAKSGGGGRRLAILGGFRGYNGISIHHLA